MFNELLKVKIDFESSHLVFPIIILIILLVLILIQAAKNPPSWKKLKKINFFPKNTNKAKLFGSIFLIIIYFKGMEVVGSFYPNMGYGFLICSIFFILLISLLFVGKSYKKKAIAIILNSILTPTLAWLLFGYFFNITLP